MNGRAPAGKDKSMYLPTFYQRVKALLRFILLFAHRFFLFLLFIEINSNTSKVQQYALLKKKTEDIVDENHRCCFCVCVFV